MVWIGDTPGMGCLARYSELSPGVACFVRHPAQSADTLDLAQELAAPEQ